MLDEKKCYLFGRNPQMNDFCIDHQSCSRVHAAFVYHRHLHRAFLVDLGSTHGTFIGSLRLESHKPTQLAPDSSFHFGASTRHYVMRQRPQPPARNIIDQLEKDKTEGGAAMLGLPETETELDNLTEFNTAHNRRISMLGIGEDGESGGGVASRRKRRGVTFSEEEEVINPEDVDPSIGKFRNMVHSTVIPAKRSRPDGIGPTSGLTNVEEMRPVVSHPMKHLHPTVVAHQLYGDLPGSDYTGHVTTNPILSSALASRLGISLPNPAPDVEMTPPQQQQQQQEQQQQHQAAAAAAAAAHAPPEPRKKKYAKEAWPGKKTTPALLV
ncbi:hypothetical protein AAG570_007212 [Ranatra chinensis]|uniref:FHA domain-containing protein n=1 Tax=Ranatra chinensis TaxID=642074 RepID=A0ABD0XV83_9HEMI